MVLWLCASSALGKHSARRVKIKFHAVDVEAIGDFFHDGEQIGAHFLVWRNLRSTRICGFRVARVWWRVCIL